MPHILCPNCHAKLRAPTDRRKLICPDCKTRFPSADSAPPADSSRFPWLWRVEAVSALTGGAAFAALVACQIMVFLPLGRAYPGYNSVVFPAVVVDETIVAPATVQVRSYNQVLFWGSAVSYLVVAAAIWYGIRLWKIALVRAGRRHGLHGLGQGRSSAWRQWGGGTAAAIVLLGGLAVAIIGRDVLWQF
jgi:hypothetical protein